VLHVVTADESHLPIAEIGATIEPRQAPPAAPAPSPPPGAGEAPAASPRALTEAFGLAAFPSSVGLRDERRAGSGVHVAATAITAGGGDDGPQLRVTGGVRGALFDERLRLDVAVPLDLAPSATTIDRDAPTQRRGSRDVYVALSSLLDGDGAFGIAIEAGAFLPTGGAGGLDRVRAVFSADLSLRLGERFAVRTRLAVIPDLTEDPNGTHSLLLALALGLDVWIAGPLTVGLELDAAVGREDTTFMPDAHYTGIRIGAAAGLGLALDLGAVSVQAAARLGTEDYVGTGASVAVRGAFR
jgi:hypothetical protein